jgi:hypothetical protein
MDAALYMMDKQHFSFNILRSSYLISTVLKP